MRYFINADDFGRNHERNIAIDTAFQRGLIHNASLIVNTPEADNEARNLAEEHGYAEHVFFHLNLVAGKPLTEGIKSTVFCGSNGEFRHASHKAIQMKCMMPDAIKIIRAECEAQMKRFRELGFTSSHIDSHEWCICSFPVWLAVRPLLKKYGFTETRTLQGKWLNTRSIGMQPYYRMLFRMMRARLRLYSDWSGPIDMLQKDLGRHRIAENALVELYVHPYIADGVLVDTLRFHEGEQIPLEEICAKAVIHGRAANEE